MIRPCLGSRLSNNASRPAPGLLKHSPTLTACHLLTDRPPTSRGLRGRPKPIWRPRGLRVPRVQPGLTPLASGVGSLAPASSPPQLHRVLCPALQSPFRQPAMALPQEPETRRAVGARARGPEELQRLPRRLCLPRLPLLPAVISILTSPSWVRPPPCSGLGGRPKLIWRLRGLRVPRAQPGLTPLAPCTRGLSGPA